VVKAHDLHLRSIVVDTHVDTTQRVVFDHFDLGQKHADGGVDIPRMREGGIGAIFFAIWQPGKITGSKAVEGAFAQIEAVRRQAKANSGSLVLARTAADIRQANLHGHIALLIGLEGGQMIDSRLDTLRAYHSLGVKYMTLTHNVNVEWADSGTDQAVHNGLTAFGEKVIQEMNRLGMIVDISHVSDKVFFDALAASQAPIFASHSSCRALCDSPRNLSDGMIEALASQDGVIQINFHVGFLSQKFRNALDAHSDLLREIDQAAAIICGDNQSCLLLENERQIRRLVAEGKLPRVEWTQIIDHIDHAVKLVGADHVGLGSDFDGANMPYGMEDASCFPKITAALLDKGYSDCDIQKILGGNMLRLMQDVETVATKMEGIQ
jgi:membrane dipeptidase